MLNPDEMAYYAPSDLDLHCLRRYPFWSTKLKGLKFGKDLLCIHLIFQNTIRFVVIESTFKGMEDEM